MTKQERVKQAKKKTIKWQATTKCKQAKKRLEEGQLVKNSRKRKIILAIAILVGCLYLFVTIRAHRVAGHSMEPTVRDNDYLIIYKGAAVKRYSLITFEITNELSESYIKRVIGMPGDAIWVDNNTLYINQQMRKNQTQPEANSFLSGEQLPDGTIKMWVTEKIAKEMYTLKKIPQHTYFVLGDNRNHSKDSRQLGLISADQIEGVVVYRYYPFSKVGQVH